MAELPPEFFNRPAPQVARDLIGKFIVRRRFGKETALMITEAEAYAGTDDLASHARFGRTARNAPMFGPPGVWYVYFTYGIHWMVNIVVGKEGAPSAVLIRAAGSVIGPARLAKFLKIDGTLTNRSAIPETGLWIEDRGVVIPARRIKKGPRVGIDYASALWRNKPWRFQLPD